jgi:ATP-binding cassette, subfamily B, multidrug efflux pump
LMDEAPEKEPEDSDLITIADFKGEIQFQNVWFSYVEDNWVTRDLSFTIKPGETVAIVGMTGGGKSTLISLLEGFYLPQKGRILLDGRDIQTLSRKALRSLIGLVPQETFLFDGDLKENILLSDAPEREKKWLALKEVLPVGTLMDRTDSGFHNGLSSGEQQLVALARVMARNPLILVLDEATSQVDAYTESLVQEGIKKLLQGRTSLVIAHRIFTLRQAARILVIHEGRLVEDGSHEVLMQKKGYYYRLYQLQFKNDFTGIE